MAAYLLCFALAAVPALSIPISTRTPKSGIAWATCDPSLSLPSNLQCANLTVPVDWNNTADGCASFNLGMVRLVRPSNSTAERIGHLFINPGGPGGSAITTVAGIARGSRNVSSDLRNSFDIIGVDPRGVGLSAGSQCDPAIWNERVSQFPKTMEDYDRLVDHNKRLGESCLNRTGNVVNFLDTISAVKDHEAVRKALG